MNYPCELIRDLLPLYHDGVCSPASTTVVEEHLAACEGCQAVHQGLLQADQVASTPPREPLADSLKKVKKKVNRRVLGVCALVLLVAGLAVGVGMWLNVATISVPEDAVTAQLIDGEDGPCVQVVLNQDYAYTGLGATSCAAPGRTGEAYTFFFVRITLWDAFIRNFQEEKHPAVDLKFDFELPLIDNFYAYLPTGTEEESVETTRFYFVPEYSRLPERTWKGTEAVNGMEGLSPEELERFIQENAILLWEK
ncbi:MAG: hypothetical protein HFE94_02860 [Acutalibacter sp.]|nr:hypothetical protein [Acutalibacter sp.]